MGQARLLCFHRAAHAHTHSNQSPGNGVRSAERDPHGPLSPSFSLTLPCTSSLTKSTATLTCRRIQTTMTM